MKSIVWEQLIYVLQGVAESDLITTFRYVDREVIYFDVTTDWLIRRKHWRGRIRKLMKMFALFRITVNSDLLYVSCIIYSFYYKVCSTLSHKQSNTHLEPII